MKWRIYFTLGFLMICLWGCGGGGGGGGGGTPNDPLKGFKANQADRGEDWTTFRSEASHGAWLFKETEFPIRPREHRGRSRVFYNGEVTAEELSIIDSGYAETLQYCQQDTDVWNPGTQWRKFEYYIQVEHFKTILIDSNYTIQEGEAAGCAGFTPYGIPAAGAVAPGTTINGAPASKGGYYALLPKQSPAQLARPECKQLLKNAARNEGEHLWMTNSPQLYFAFANDGQNGNHPYCRGIVGQSALLTFISRLVRSP